MCYLCRIKSSSGILPEIIFVAANPLSCHIAYMFSLLKSNLTTSPYDNPLLWTGHSTVIDEIITQLLESPSSANLKIGAVLASVGGGGLLAGIFEGIERNYYSGDEIRTNVVRGSKVIACETDGAASFAASFDASASREK